ncbi:right-handed parallel beta-helix repeat-containing protein [bacterium]|nr:right-handed parallel beta-helix repeat-containing protein [bacterium]
MCDRMTAIYIFAVLCLSCIAGPASSSIWYVKWNSTGNESGYTWANSFHAISDAIDAAIPGDEIWVAGDITHPYKECIILPSGVALYGGFAGSESAKNQRNWLANNTIIDGNQAGTVITIPDSAISTTRIDGFTIQNGKYSTSDTGSGIHCLYAGSPVIAHNTITGNNASNGGGIYCSGASPTIINNLIVGNEAGDGGGIYCTSYSSPIIANNTILSNTSLCLGGAIYSFASSPSISNNIVVFNSSGIYRYGGLPVLRNNDFYQNIYTDYDGISAGDGDISVDPQFADYCYHIKSTSPCVDAGIIVDGVSDDIDGQGRYSGTSFDIGADEYSAPIEVKKARDGNSVVLNNVVITASFDDCCYVETTDRTMGIRVENSASSYRILPNTLVNVIGQCNTNENGERYIAAAIINQTKFSYQLKPLGLSNSSIGNGSLGYQRGVYGWIIRLDAEKKPYRVWGPVSGLNNIGLLIKTWGKVTDKEQDTATWFTIDDGSDLDIKCTCSSGVSVNVGDSVFVTGVVSCEKVGGELRPVIRMRGSSDLAWGDK